MTKDQRLSTAIHILAAMAFMAPAGLRSRELARSLRANPSFVRRILSRLSKAGLVRSERGSRLGNRLARPAGQITVKDVYLALDRTRFFKSFEKKPFKDCPISCGMRSALDRIYRDLEKDLLKKMQRISIRKIVASIPVTNR